MGVQVAAHTLHLALDFGNNLKFVITTGYLLLPAIKKNCYKKSTSMHAQTPYFNNDSKYNYVAPPHRNFQEMPMNQYVIKLITHLS